MDFILAFVPSWAGEMWANGAPGCGSGSSGPPSCLSSRDGLWIIKKRLEEDWERTEDGEKGNGMECPFRRRKIELCMKSLCQRLPSSCQCYHSPAALGQGADNPPREFRGGNTSAGLGGWNWEQHMWVCAKHDTAPSEAPVEKVWGVPRL